MAGRSRVTPSPGKLDDAARLRLALEAFGTGIWDWHLPSGELYLSPSWKAQLGFADDELPSTYATWESRVHPDDLPDVLAKLQDYLDGETSAYDVEFRLLAKQGDYRWMRARGSVVERDAAGKPIRLIGTHDDVTDRKEAELALQRSEEKFANLFELSPDAIGISRMTDGCLVEVNRGLEEITGYSREELIGFSTLDLWIDPQARVELVRKVAEEGDVVAEVHRFKARDGHVVDGLVSIRRIMHADEAHLLFVVRDVSALAATQAALRDSEARWQFALDGAGSGVWDWNLARDTLYLSPGWKLQLGYRDDELANEFATWESRLHPDDKARVMSMVEDYLAGRTANYDIEFRMRAKHGEYLWIRARGKIVERDQRGAPARMIGVHDDVTDRKNAEIALRQRVIALTRPLDVAEDIEFTELVDIAVIQELQDMFADAFGVASLITTPDGVPITRPSNFSHLCGDLIRTNPEGAKYCEHSDAILGRHNADGPNIHHCLSAGLCNAGASITVGGRHVANWLIGQVRDETHTERQIIDLAKTIGADTAGLVAAFRDIPFMPREQFERIARILHVIANQISTMAYQNVQQARFIAERQRAEDDLVESQARYREAQSLAHMGHWSYAIDTRRFMWVSEETMRLLDLGPEDAELDFAGFIERVHPDDRDRVDAIVAASVSTGDPFQIEYRVGRAGGQPRYLQARGTAHRANDGHVERLSGTVMDVTDRHLAELRLLTFHALAEGSMDAIVIADPRDTRLTYANRAAHVLFGCDHARKEMVGRMGSEFWPPEDLDIMASVVAQGVAGGWRGDVRQRRGNGDVFDANASVFTIEGAYGGAEQIVAIIRDIGDKKQAEAALRRSELTYREIFNSVNDCIWIHDVDTFEFVDVNQVVQTMFGYSREEAMSLSVGDISSGIGPCTLAGAVSYMTRAAAGEPQVFEWHCRHKDGHLFWTEVSLKRGTIADVERILAIERDITARKLAEDALRLTQFSVDHASEAIFWYDRHGRFGYVNDEACRMLGYSREALLAMCLQEVDANLRPAEFPARMDALLAAGSANFETTLRRRDGGLVSVAIAARLIRFGEQEQLVAYVRDVTEQKLASEALRREKAFSDSLIDSLPGVFYLFDERTRLVRWNQNLLDFTGYKSDILTGMNAIDFIAVEDREAVAETIRRVLVEGAGSVEARLLDVMGAEIPYFFTGRRMHDGDAVYVVGTGIDISERREAEEALRLIRFGVERSSDAVYLIDSGSRFLDVNEAACQALGYGKTALLGMTVMDIDPGVNAEAAAGMFQTLRDMGRLHFETLHRRRDGSVFPVEINANYIEFGGREYNFCYAHDITARKGAEEALKLSEARFRAVINNITEVISIVDAQGISLYQSPALESVYGYQPESFIGNNALALVHPDDQASASARFAALVAAPGAVDTLEYRYRHADGRWLDVESNAIALLDEPAIGGVLITTRDITARKRADAALRLTRRAIEVSAMAFEWYDHSGRIIDVNAQCCRDLGYGREEMLTLRLCDIDPEFPEESWPEIFATIKSMGVLVKETMHRRKDGSLFPVLVNATYVESGGNEYIFSYAQDITERNRVERQLKATQHAIDHACAAFEWLDSDGMVVSCNIEAHRAMGYTRDEFIGKHVWDYDPDMSPEKWARLWEVLKRDGHATIETRHRRKDGVIFPIEVTVNHGMFGDDEYCFAYITDITERKAAEEQLRLTQFAVDSSSIAFQWGGPDGRIMGCNLRAHESLGLTRDELIGKYVWDIDPDFPTDGMAAHWTALKQAGKLTFESRHRHRDGHVFPVEVTANFGEFGGKEYTFAYVVDITERKAADQHLRLIQQAVDRSSVAFEWLDMDGRIISGNIQAYESLGYTRDEFVGMAVWDFTPGLSEELWRRHIAQLREHGSEVVEGAHRRKDGTVFPIEVRANYVNFGEREYIFSYINDISERKAAEQALRDSEKRLAELIDFLPDATFAIDTHGAVIAWNRAMETMSGVGKADVLGKADRAYAQVFYGYKRPMLIDLIFDYDEAAANRYDIIRKDGDALVTEDQTAYLYGERRIALWGKAAPLRDTTGRITGAVQVIRDITEQKDAERELRFSAERFRSVVSNTPVLIFEFDDEGVFKLSEGRGLKALGLESGELVHTSVCEFFHDDPVVCEYIRNAIRGESSQFTARIGKTVFETFFNPVMDARSKRMSVIGVAVDITERTEREVELQQKTDEMTRFTYTVSHDLKSPLVTIRTFLGFLEQDILKQDAERIDKDMGFIRKAAEKMTRLLEELLELSRIGRVVNSPVDTPFGGLVREAVDLVAGRIVERGVEVRIDAPAITIHGDRQRLVEVFQNLVDNAVKFMGTQPKPSIEIGADMDDGVWVFHVRDNGIGLDARHLHKVFGLFEKLDANAEGTGIGLTLVKRIVEIHGGRIWVESPGPGRGATFYFTLDAVRGVEQRG